MENFHGFLLSTIRYGDHDAVLHCYTMEEGFKSFFVKGIYAPKNKKKAFLTPLNELILTVKIPKASQMTAVSQLERVSKYDFGQDFRAGAVLFFIADFLNQILHNERENPVIYKDIRQLLEQLFSGNYSAYLSFLIRLLTHLGIAPLLSADIYLNPESGIFEALPIHSLFSADISAVWKVVLAQNEAVIIPNSARKSLLESILYYYAQHFSGFRRPKSLEVVQEIFN